MKNILLKPVEVVRDQYGYWTHPDLSKVSTWGQSERITGTQFELLMHEQKLEIQTVFFDGDAPKEITKRYENGDPNVSDWQPTIPQGDGWFMLSLHDTEDSPICWWVRRPASSHGMIKAFTAINARRQQEEMPINPLAMFSEAWDFRQAEIDRLQADFDRTKTVVKIAEQILVEENICQLAKLIVSWPVEEETLKKYQGMVQEYLDRISANEDNNILLCDENQKLRAEVERLKSTSLLQAVSEVDLPIPYKAVIQAIYAVNKEAQRRGEMFPQTADEQREVREAVIRVAEYIEWYATKGGAVAEKLSDWPKTVNAQSQNKEGYVLVPKRPTKNMINQGYFAHDGFFTNGAVVDVWEAMIAAAQEAGK